MKRRFFILSFLVILTFASGSVALAGDIKRDEPKELPKEILNESELEDSIRALLTGVIRLKVFDFGKTEFNKWTDSKEYKLALDELENWLTDDSDVDHMANAIMHLEKELKQHPQNAYAEYYLSYCKHWSTIGNEDEAEVEALRKEQHQHLSNCIDKLPSADVDSKIRVFLERSNIYSNLIFFDSEKLTDEEKEENEEKSNKDLMQAFELRPTYETFKLIYDQNKFTLPDDLEREMALIALKNDPNNVDLNLILGDTYKNEAPEEALKYYNSACGQHNSAKALVTRAQFYASNDDYSNALNDVVEADKRFDLAKEKCDGITLNETLEKESVDILCQIAAVNDMWFNRVANTCDNGTLSKYKNYILGNTLSSKEYYNEEVSKESYNKAITYLTKAIEENTIEGLQMVDCIQSLANCYVAIDKVDKAADVFYKNSDKLGRFISALFNLEIEHKLYDRCISDAKTLYFAEQIEDKDMLDYVGHAQFLKHDYNAVIETYGTFILAVRDYNNEDIPLSDFIEEGRIDFFYYACSLIITGLEEEGRELMSLMSDDAMSEDYIDTKIILTLHFAGRDAEAIAALDKKIDDSIFVGENNEKVVNLTDVCLYTILGQRNKAKQLISSDEYLLINGLDDMSESADDAINENIDEIILELSDTPLIDLTEFKQLIRSN